MKSKMSVCPDLQLLLPRILIQTTLKFELAFETAVFFDHNHSAFGFAVRNMKSSVT